MGKIDMASLLQMMSEWSRYSSLRANASGTKKVLDGEWRILADRLEYWKFSGTEFYRYAADHVTDDNYMRGSMEVLTGKEGFEKVGLDPARVDVITQQSKGTIAPEHIITVLLHTDEVVKAGKSSPYAGNALIKLVWIIVEHPGEGLEGQVISLITNDTVKFVKMAD